MATMRQIRKRIRVAGDIAQITGAMEMVAAARLKKAQDRLMAARPYVRALEEIVSELIAGTSVDARHPLAAERPEQPAAVFVVTADRGLCGSYNSGVFRLTEQTLPTLGPDPRLMVIGRRGRAYFRRRGHTLHELPVEESSQLGFPEAVQIARALEETFLKRVVNRVWMVYTEYVSPITQRPTLEQLLPLAPPETDQPVTSEYICEPDAARLMDSLLPGYLTARVYYALLESATSEHAARMTSMSAATDNATQMISSLTLALNRARQAAITKEISEIVSGAEALGGQM